MSLTMPASVFASPHAVLTAVTNVQTGCLLQAVNRSIIRLMPWTTVVEAKHCCYSVATRIQDEDGDWGQWELDVNQLHQIQVLGL